MQCSFKCVLREEVMLQGEMQGKLFLKYWNHFAVLWCSEPKQRNWYNCTVNYVTQTSLKNKIIYHTVSHVFAICVNPPNIFVQTLWRCFEIVSWPFEEVRFNPLLCDLAGVFLWPSLLQQCPWTRLAMMRQRCQWAGAGSGFMLLTGSCGCCWLERSGSSWLTSPSLSSTFWSRGTST